MFAKVSDMTGNTVPEKEKIEKVISALKANGIEAELVATKEDAREKVMSLLPKGAEVMSMTSVTLTESGIDDAIKSSDEHVYVKEKLYILDEGDEKRAMGAAPQYAIGSIHAVTEEGHVLIASNTGSQLPAYAYGAGHVIWVVGVQKIVKNTDEGFRRIYDYVLPLEAERAHKAYGVPGSNVSKVLIVNKEVKPSRISLIFINEQIGF